MPLFAAAFLAGVMLLHLCVTLPALAWAGLLPFLVHLIVKWPRLRPVWALCAGFLWALVQGHVYLNGLPPPALEGVDLTLTGVIADVPQRRDRALRFEFEPDAVYLDDRLLKHPLQRVRLSWYNEAPALGAGQRWRLRVRLKRPNGFMNPGGFDYETWLYTQGIQATGYVRAGSGNRPLAEAGVDLNALRQALAGEVDRALEGRANAGVINALSLGLRGGIPPERWRLLLDTGTNHLMAISGLHVSLIAAMAYFVVLRLWACSSGLCAMWPAQRAAALTALLAATGYAAMAGFSIPTQRALIMLAVVMGAIALARPLRALQGLGLALLLVLVWDPRAVLAPGFSLSFAAVAFILYALGARLRTARHPAYRLVLWGRLQGVIALGLLPASLWLFQRGVGIAPIANLIAVPWVSFTVVPTALAGTACVSWAPALGASLLWIADRSLDLLWPLLEFLQALPFAYWTHHPGRFWSVLSAMAGVLWLLAPRGIPGRVLGLVLMLPVFVLRAEGPARGEAWVSVLDVGQGLAVVVRAHEHTLVYDTGARFSSRFNAGEAVVLPYLRAQGRRRIDRLVVSHGDSDHIGGAASLIRSLPVGEVSSSVPERIEHPRVRACEAGEGWSWEGVNFQMLHPLGGEFAPGNNRSCVLRVSTRGGAVLLTGDIEKEAEAALVRRYGAALASDVLLAPHHGSLSSSSEPFLEAVAPRVVLVAAGYRNRWGFPRPEVVARYQRRGAALVTTADQGTLSLHLGQEGVQLQPGYRRHRGRFWHR